MKNLITIISVLLIWTTGSAQEISLETGLNFTSYDYENSMGVSNENVTSSSGLYSRLGLASFRLLKQKINYGISFQQFNATGGDGYENYDWKTNYLGGFLQYQKPIYKNLLAIQASADFLYLASGKQKIGGETFSLNDEKEVNGFWLNPSIGLFTKIIDSNTFGLDLGYNFSMAIKPNDQGSESLSYVSNQLYFRIHLKTNKQDAQDHEHNNSNVGAPGNQVNMAQEIQTLKLAINSLKQPSKQIPEVTVFFNLDSYKIDKDQYQKLEALADYLRNNTATVATLVGYADDTTGNTESNQTLSDNRALSVREFLISKQVNPTQCTVKGAGETSQFNQKIYDSNRRVLIVLTQKQ